MDSAGGVTSVLHTIFHVLLCYKSTILLNQQGRNYKDIISFTDFFFFFFFFFFFGLARANEIQRLERNSFIRTCDDIHALLAFPDSTSFYDCKC